MEHPKTLFISWERFAAEWEKRPIRCRRGCMSVRLDLAAIFGDRGKHYDTVQRLRLNVLTVCKLMVKAKKRLCRFLAFRSPRHRQAGGAGCEMGNPSGCLKAAGCVAHEEAVKVAHKLS